MGPVFLYIFPKFLNQSIGLGVTASISISVSIKLRLELGFRIRVNLLHYVHFYQAYCTLVMRYCHTGLPDLLFAKGINLVYIRAKF